MRANATGDTPFMTITVVDVDPVRPAAVANVFKDTLPDVGRTLDPGHDLDTSVAVLLAGSRGPGVAVQCSSRT